MTWQEPHVSSPSTHKNLTVSQQEPLTSELCLRQCLTTKDKL